MNRLSDMASRLTFVSVRSGAQAEMAEAVLQGLSAPCKSLPTRFLYDQRGSELFELITGLPEYYLTRTEQMILRDHAHEIVHGGGDDVMLIEFGSGSSLKTRTIISALLAKQQELTYVPIDISEEFLHTSAEALMAGYKGLRVQALAAEYFDAIEALPDTGSPRLILFLGSNIGNFTRPEAIDFLGRIRRHMKPTDRILLGIDLVKDPAIITAAYNDSQGVTAAFNRNLLTRINQDLGGHFEPGCFTHTAPYDEAEERIEMQLVSTSNQEIAIDALGRSFHFGDGEIVHTEWSHKYSFASFEGLANEAGLCSSGAWSDPKSWFGVVILKPGGVGMWKSVHGPQTIDS